MLSFFENREQAGRRLAELLIEYRRSDSVIIGIPRHGIPVAAAAAHELGVEWSFIVTQKLPIPSNPDAGFGAMAEDGTIALNREMLKGLQMTQKQIDSVVDTLRAEIAHREAIYSQAREPLNVLGKRVFVVDDGMSSGYTMNAAIKSLRNHNPASIIASTPVASRSAAALISKAADQCVIEIISPAVPFAISDFYITRRVLTDEDILPILKSKS